MKTKQSTIFEISKPGRFALDLPKSDVPAYEMETLVPSDLLRSKYAQLPEVSQPDLIRHYTALSRRNFGVDSGFYPLGSCTMKYNPKVNEDVCRYPGFADIHPLQDVESIQGALELLYQMEQYLAEIAGMDAVTMQPVAGAHGELTGLKLIRQYHRSRGEVRTKVIVPDSAHGTNPATATVCGLEIVEIKSNDDGSINLDALKAAVGLDTAAFMLTNPSTLGLFEKNIKEIAQIVHAAGGLLYYDGANTNAVMGIVRPGDMGFDVVHINLHKTFSTPHGGGGPGSGPVGVKQELIPFLPVPIVTYNGKKYDLEYDRPLSIGRMHSFYGNFGVIVRAYAYIRTMGPDGLRQASEDAVLNANYCLSQLREDYYAPFDRYSMHECIITSKNQKQFGVKTLDIAKRLLDYGYHPPTIYFPLIVEEAIMIEPTETESKETLDGFIKAMREIAKEARTDVTQILNAPHDTVVGRLDETAAARKPVVRWKP
ncbi:MULTISPECIES: aminomethyl-transferring glycine dehydrogenase subunit GcvPB [Pelosinus]|uniref:Probable glycine dehydrogenase (decarboxylating) subunit 2 n=1 Tax=Pelosinus fermentans B4 TaxID=1149862 RepID=I9LF43_9FIRM|nr:MULTISPECIES: aminomethyl-transferring glycine dehydrogenase subunit GcvPB [Pelosinus]EIW18976.1 Glycine cleavage system P-protein [Pelosinus fermentans B4]EIW21814.1 glycine dehydrogenase (decarboxylating) subunit 2 [Pelosinus fermentans A11]OAM95336.1 glycine dehydrogenase (decarboxylating) subunit 2 [Pelosinus fermentans DSM 17108]SDR26642.1 glycine dehydrogenase (decarboxylating) beta subunit [Pelosinus fermentans]